MMRRLFRASPAAAKESGQAMAETALLYALVMFGGAALLNWAPDTLNALNDYMMGIHYVVGTPLG